MSVKIKQMNFNSPEELTDYQLVYFIVNAQECEKKYGKDLCEKEKLLNILKQRNFEEILVDAYMSRMISKSQADEIEKELID